MDIGYHKFYEKESKIFFGIFASILVLVSSLILNDTDLENVSTFKRFCYRAMPFLSSYAIIGLLFKLFSSEPYIEITPKFIKINDCKLSWNDIINIKYQTISNGYGRAENMFLDVKNASKYKKKILLPPAFVIQLDYLSKKDREELKCILKKCFPNSNIE